MKVYPNSLFLISFRTASPIQPQITTNYFLLNLVESV